MLRTSFGLERYLFKWDLEIVICYFGFWILDAIRHALNTLPYL
jgi:hypothetical protein